MSDSIEKAVNEENDQERAAVEAEKALRWSQKFEDDWNALKPVKQWEWAIAHKDQIALRLDNDATYLHFRADEVDADEWESVNFKSWLGNGPGVQILLTTLGIEADGV